MKFYTISIIAKNSIQAHQWEKDVKDFLKHYPSIHVQGVHEDSRIPLGEVIFVDFNIDSLEQRLRELKASRKIVFLVVPSERQSIPVELFVVVDDILVTPFRYYDLLSRIRIVEYLIQLKDVQELNTSLFQLIERFKEDLQLAERLQKKHLPKRFPKIKGIQATSRYLAGLKPGGDSFDIAESRSKTHLALFFSNASSYGLSNLIFSLLIRLIAKISRETMTQLGATQEILTLIIQEIRPLLGDSDQLSLFFGIYSKKDQTLSYVNLGDIFLGLSSNNAPLQSLSSQTPPLQKIPQTELPEEKTLSLTSGDRFILLSKGFMECFSSQPQLIETLESMRNHEAQNILNELAFRVQTKGSGTKEMPERDCTGIILDIEKALHLPKIRLVSKTKENEPKE